ncbi:MAG: alpha/beta hydrolase [Acidobacteriaceae bacterium]|nr:alpha/beta hydrolase [Acidobacteriaceae bacterium]
MCKRALGPHTMVLIHGFPETWWQWRYTMPLFAQAGFRVIAVDYRGAGNSSKPAGGYDKRMMAADIRALLDDHLARYEPVIMVGHDIGMTVAFAFAGLYPDAVERLVLVDAIVPGTNTFQALLTTGKLRNSNLAHFFFHNARNNVSETLTAGRERMYLQNFFDRIAFSLGAFGPEVIDTYAAYYSAPGGMKAGFEAYRAFDQDAEDNAAMLTTKGRLKMPVLFVAGTESFLGTIGEDVLNEIAVDGSVSPPGANFGRETNPDLSDASETVVYPAISKNYVR